MDAVNVERRLAAEMPRLPLTLLMAVLMLLGLLLAPVAQAQPDDFDALLDAARQQITSAQKVLEAPLKDGADLVALRTQVLQAGSRAADAVQALEPQIVSLQARLDGLGPPVAGQPDAPDVAVLRAQLKKSRAALDAQLQRGKLIMVESEQTAGQVSALRRSEFQARLGERTDSVVSEPFWAELQLELPGDLRRTYQVLQRLREAPDKRSALIWSGVALVLLLLLGLRIWTGRALLTLTATRVPPGRLRRSLHAGLLVLLSSVTAAVVAQVLYLALRRAAIDPEAAADLLTGLAGTAAFAGYVAGLGQALLLPARPSWRLLPLPDALSLRLRWLPVTLAALIMLIWSMKRLTEQANASFVATVAVDLLVALALALLIGLALLRARRARHQALRDGNAAPQWPSSPMWLSGLLVLAATVVVSCLLALLLGYVALGSFLLQQMVWAVVVLGTAYLLSVVIDDGFTALLCPRTPAPAPESAAGQALEPPAPTLLRVRRQAAVLLSGAGRLLVLALAFMLLLAPYGEGPTELFQRADQLQQGIAIGEFQLKPLGLLQALLIAVLGLTAVRLLKHWLSASFLPTTALDPGMQLSMATLFGYVGAILAVSMGLAALGIGLERIAWVASALSVGIGFGLQAVVQNFVSGLIMLAERPVKVGDWVSLGGIEGDIRRINVRATEIQMNDRSTVIVPNSEFITKTVRNVTHDNPLGLVKIMLPLPLTTDADQVRSLVLQAFESHADVLESPAPNVQLDSLDHAGMLFNATAYVASPRLTYGVRSALLFDVLGRLRQAGVALANSPTLVLREGEQDSPLQPPLPAQPPPAAQAPVPPLAP
ncbi:MAG: DUF3772 domain-containing protein [Polaromonas sp.]